MMISKSEAETALRQLIYQWSDEVGLGKPTDFPIFDDFVSWLDSKGYSHYMNFRSPIGAREQTARWFDEILKQNWRN